MNQEMELLIYLLTSAESLPCEPQSYGPLRLVEAASRVCHMLSSQHPENVAYKRLESCIEAGKGKTLTEPDQFFDMLREASDLLVDCL